MNKLRMTGAGSRAYERLHLAQESRTCSPEIPMESARATENRAPN